MNANDASGRNREVAGALGIWALCVVVSVAVTLAVSRIAGWEFNAATVVVLSGGLVAGFLRWQDRKSGD